ncbi:hypothetical protein QBC45DRAFT_456892 [Copromyces sp. CBS 386.78]|nr:hypothetical protein QBC45DRAFT_456892 [Copromyces sp. CBS 386.78]
MDQHDTSNPSQSLKAKQKKWKQCLQDKFARLQPKHISESGDLDATKTEHHSLHGKLAGIMAKEEKPAKLQTTKHKSSEIFDITKAPNQWVKEQFAEYQTKDKSSEVFDTIKAGRLLLQEALAEYQTKATNHRHQVGKLDPLELLGEALAEYQTKVTKHKGVDLDTLQSLQDALAELQTTKHGKSSGIQDVDTIKLGIHRAISLDKSPQRDESESEDLSEFSYMYEHLGPPPSYEDSCPAAASQPQTQPQDSQASSSTCVRSRAPLGSPLLTPVSMINVLQARQFTRPPVQNGGLNDQTLNGDVYVDILKGISKVKIFNGNLHINILDGTLDINTFNGDLHINECHMFFPSILSDANEPDAKCICQIVVWKTRP